METITYLSAQRSVSVRRGLEPTWHALRNQQCNEFRLFERAAEERRDLKELGWHFTSKKGLLKKEASLWKYLVNPLHVVDLEIFPVTQKKLVMNKSFIFLYQYSQLSQFVIYG